MSMIPDCRNDDSYNQRYLNEEDKKYLEGFDFCMEYAADNFFENMVYEIETKDTHLARILSEKLPESQREEYEAESSFFDVPETRKIETYADLLRYMSYQWIGLKRDELITSMIDNMDEKEYEAIKKRVDAEINEKRDTGMEFDRLSDEEYRDLKKRFEAELNERN